MRRQTPDLILCKLQPQIVCFHHVTHAFRVNPRSTPSCYLNVKVLCSRKVRYRKSNLLQPDLNRQLRSS